MTDTTQPSRAQINEWMRDAGWQNIDIRQADLDKVERVVRAALAATSERFEQMHASGDVWITTIAAAKLVAPHP